ncbi:MAG TPA: TetR/AcrR family transcriptional regulator [Anaerolineales bacterium]
MKNSTPVRKYHSQVRAEAEALTHQRIISAALSLYAEKWLDQITLDQIANQAGVSVQTVLRHFGNAEALISAAGRVANDRAIQQRQDPPVGDIPRAIAGLMDHYEDMAPTGLRTLALEGRYPELDALLVEGRQKHQEWVERVFSPYLNRAPKKDRQRLKVELASLCDMYMWKLLRMDGGLSPEQAELSFNEMLTALLAQKHLLE